VFFQKQPHVFKVSSKLHLDILHYKKRKWMCVEISLVHLLHHIHEDIYIFKEIFNEHKLSQLRGLHGVNDTVAWQLLFVPSHFFVFSYALYLEGGGGGGFP
jgi:hypothetical protein